MYVLSSHILEAVQDFHLPLGYRAKIIIIRVALGMSNTLSGRSGARTASSLAPTGVRIGYNMPALTDTGRHVGDDARVHIDHAKSKPGAEDWDWGCRSTEHSA